MEVKGLDKLAPPKPGETIAHRQTVTHTRFVPTSEDRQCFRCGGILDYLYGLWFKCRKCSRWERGW